MPRGNRKLTGNVIMHKSGILIRDGTCDEYVPSQIKQYAKLYMRNKIVLDLGGHIGAFAKYALDAGALYCLSVEPMPDNVELWHRNITYGNSGIVVGAVVGSDAQFDGTVQLSVSNGDTTGHSIDAIAGRSAITVKAYTLEQLLQYASFRIVKMDIEGAEYSIMHDAAKLFPEYGVTQFAAELHLNRKDQRKKAIEFVNLFDRYYHQVVPVKIGAKNWNTTGIWELR
jgi:FkbM family methyltransferase